MPFSLHDQHPRNLLPLQAAQAEPAGTPNVSSWSTTWALVPQARSVARAGCRPPSGWAELPSGGAADGQQG